MKLVQVFLEKLKYVHSDDIYDKQSWEIRNDRTCSNSIHARRIYIIPKSLVGKKNIQFCGRDGCINYPKSKILKEKPHDCILLDVTNDDIPPSLNIDNTPPK